MCILGTGKSSADRTRGKSETQEGFHSAYFGSSWRPSGRIKGGKVPLLTAAHMGRHSHCGVNATNKGIQMVTATAACVLE